MGLAAAERLAAVQSCVQKPTRQRYGLALISLSLTVLQYGPDRSPARERQWDGSGYKGDARIRFAREMKSAKIYRGTREKGDERYRDVKESADKSNIKKKAKWRRKNEEPGGNAPRPGHSAHRGLKAQRDSS